MVFIAAGLWGLYWLPLRAVEEAGINQFWAIMAVYLVPLLVITPVAIIRWRQVLARPWDIALIGILIGAGLACYASGFLFTTVMRTTLLFYLTPVWSTLLGMLLLAEKPPLRRWFAMATGFAGLSIMLTSGQADQPSLSLNLGDLLALASGFLWGAGSVWVRRNAEINSLDTVPAQYFFATLFALFALWLTADLAHPPSLAAWQAAMPWLLGYFVLIMLPSLYACIRVAQIISPGRVGILMMSEVLVAGISAPLWAGESLSGREWLAAALIILAGILEVTSSQTSPQNPDARKLQS